MNIAGFIGSATAHRFTLLMTFAPLAWAADAQIRLADPTEIPLVTLAWVFGLSAAGWFASSARTLAGWVDGDGKARLENRLGILGRLMASMIAGFAAELLGMAAGTSNLLNFLAVIGAAYAGDRFIERRLGGDGTGRVNDGGAGYGHGHHGHNHGRGDD